MKITNDGRAPALVDTVVDYARIEIDSDAMLVSRGCFQTLCARILATQRKAQCPAKQTVTWAEHGVSRVSR